MKILAKAWVAIRDDIVISSISMKVPSDVNFEDFRTNAIKTLSLIGEVKVGDIIEIEGEMLFLPRKKSHQNRSKKAPKAAPVPLKMLLY